MPADLEVRLKAQQQTGATHVRVRHLLCSHVFNSGVILIAGLALQVPQFPGLAQTEIITVSEVCSPKKWSKTKDGLSQH